MKTLEIRNGYKLEQIGGMYQVIDLSTDASVGYVYTERKAYNLLTRAAGK